MGEYSYYNIYSTKGIEYLFVIAFLIGLILYWRFLNRAPAEEAASEKGDVRQTLDDMVEWFRMPVSYLFHQGHTWLKRSDADVVTIGMSDFAQKMVGRVESITLPEIGAHVSQGNTAWQLNLHSESIPMLSPVDGEIVAVNEAILSSTDLINRDPYGEGWLVKVRPTRLDANVRNLLTDKIAKSWLGGIVQDLRAQMNDGLVPVYQDGGELIQGIARAMAGEKWATLVKTYFLSE